MVYAIVELPIVLLGVYVWLLPLLGCIDVETSKRWNVKSFISIFFVMLFEELNMRKEAQSLYNTLDDIFSTSSFKNYFFRDQILRATLSISNNIAEWFERETNNELRRFLYIAKGSCWEVRSMLYLAYSRQYIQENDFIAFVDTCKHISIMIYKYIEKLK